VAAGKFIVSFVASVVCAVLKTASDDSEMIIYASALLGGILGAAIAFLIIKLLPTKTLTCPQCNHQFVNNSQWGVTCENCKTKLKVSNDQVTLQERA